MPRWPSLFGNRDRCLRGLRESSSTLLQIMRSIHFTHSTETAAGTKDYFAVLLVLDV